MSNRLSVILVLLVLIFFFTTLWLWQRVDNLEEKIANQSVQTETPSLHILMGYMQEYMHKFTYAAENEEGELADFYLHELEELSGDIIQLNRNTMGFPLVSLPLLCFSQYWRRRKRFLKKKTGTELKNSHR